jgi:RND family efflux transporter MFP subunit
MLELIFGLYGFIWWLIFKKYKLLPINLWTVVTSIYAAVVFMALLLLVLNRYQPITPYARFLALTTPIVSEVSGKVIEVLAQEGVPLKSGDVLMKIDSTPFRSRVTSVQAQLTLAEAVLNQEATLDKRGAGNKGDVRKAQADVDRLRADLEVAQFNLDATEIRAPADGYALQVAVRPGQFVTPTPFAQVMVFVHTHAPLLVASFKQNATTFIDSGDKAEVAFDSLPGQVFKARVKNIQGFIAQGQITASGRVIDPEALMSQKGTTPISLEMVDDMSAYHLPPGSSATVAVFTGKLHHLDLVRRIILRIKSRENWVFFP